MLLGKLPSISTECRQKSVHVSSEPGGDATMPKPNRRACTGAKVVRKPRKSKKDMDQSPRDSPILCSEGATTIRESGGTTEKGPNVRTLLVDSEANNQLGGSKRKRKDPTKNKKRNCTERGDDVSNDGDAETDATTTVVNTTIIGLTDQEHVDTPPIDAEGEGALGSPIETIKPEHEKLNDIYMTAYSLLQQYETENEKFSGIVNTPKFKETLDSVITELLGVVTEGKLPDDYKGEYESFATLYRRVIALRKLFFTNK